MSRYAAHNTTLRKIVIYTGAFALLSLLMLWSFNTLSELFGWPEARYKHAIAACALLLILRWGLTSTRTDTNATKVRH